MPTPTAITPTPVSPITATPASSAVVSPGVNAPSGPIVPTFPVGSKVDFGSGPTTITPSNDATPSGGTDQATFSRIATTPTGTNTQQPKEAYVADARDKALASMSATLGDIDKTYNESKADILRTQGSQNTGRENAIAAARGLMGSTGANDRLAVADDRTDKAVGQNEQKRAAALAGAMAQINETGNRVTEEAGKEYDATTQANSEESQNNAKDALQKIAGILGNVSFSQFKSSSPATYDKLVKIMGGNAAGLELLYNDSMTSKADKANYSWHDGKAFYFDPKTSQITRRPDLDTTTPAAQSGASKVVNFGGTLYNFPIDEKGNYKIDTTKPLSYYQYSTTGQFKSTPQPKNPTGTVEKFNTDLSKWNLKGTREQLIRQLQARYPDIEPTDISRKVYETYPDNFQNEQGGGSSNSSTDNNAIIPGVS